MASFADSAGQTARYLLEWQVLGQLMSAVGQPFLQQLTNQVWHAHPVLPMSPADLAQAVNRNFTDQATASDQAKFSGVPPEVFDILVDLAGRGPAPGDLATMLRRGIITADGRGAAETTFEQGIAEGDVRDKWAGAYQALAQEWPTPTAALQALLKGQVDQQTAQALYEQFGGAPQFFQLLFDTQGEGPTPTEAGRMANRGLIPWTGRGAGVVSFEQAFHESQWRNKWQDAFRGIAEYFPPPRTITAMVRDGSMSDQEGTKWLLDQGLSPELAAAYITSAHHSRTASERNLTQATVVGLYKAGAVTEAQAKELLELIHYSAEDAQFILTLADMQRELTAINEAIARIRALYVAYKIDDAGATNALNALKLPTDHTTELLAVWKLEKSVNIKMLTEGQIVSAMFYGVIDQGTAQQELERLGYTPYDAWVLLSVRNKGPLPNPPARGALTNIL